MTILKNILLLLYFTLNFNISIGQQFAIGVESGVGFIMAHRENVLHLAQSHPIKMEFSFINQKDGNKEWQHIFNLPRVDHSISLVDYKNPILGKTIAYTIQLGYPIIKKRDFKLYTDIGLGVGLNTNKFDRISNYTNNVISTTLIGSLHGKMYGEYQLSDYISLDVGIGLIHFSNGSFKVPNLGINIPYTQLGLVYSLSQNELINREKIILNNTEDKKWNFSVQLSNGLKDVFPTGGKKHLYNTIGIHSYYKLNKVYRLVSGFDGFYDRSVNERRFEEGLDNEQNYNSKVGFMIGQELRVGEISVATHFGRYLYQAYFTTYLNGYQRYQLKYHINKHYYGAVAMKIHKGVADVIELTFGVEL